MMRRELKVVGLAILTYLPAAATVNAGDAGPKPLTVTYVGNTGYLIECDGHKVAIDALLGGAKSEYYDIPSDSVVALMVAAQPPFDGIDVIAVTHRHDDHFSADIVGKYLSGNSGCELLCSQQVADKLSVLPGYETFRKQIRIVNAPLDSVTSFSINGIAAQVLSSKHGAYYETDSTGKRVDRHRNVQHLEFLFTIAGRSFLHVGDVDLQDRNQFQPLGLGRDSIDIAFVQVWGCHEMMSFGEKLVRDCVLPKRIFFTHIAPKLKPWFLKKADCASYRQVTFPTRSLQSWIIP
jgi:L-ascorbate metabolism protein UlaG (beta-lactamase superfamily)